LAYIRLVNVSKKRQSNYGLPFRKNFEFINTCSALVYMDHLQERRCNQLVQMKVL